MNIEALTVVDGHMAHSGAGSQHVLSVSNGSESTGSSVIHVGVVETLSVVSSAEEENLLGDLTLGDPRDRRGISSGTGVEFSGRGNERRRGTSVLG